MLDLAEVCVFSFTTIEKFFMYLYLSCVISQIRLYEVFGREFSYFISGGISDDSQCLSTVVDGLEHETSFVSV